jgi:hypothetical protein
MYKRPNKKQLEAVPQVDPPFSEQACVLGTWAGSTHMSKGGLWRESGQSNCLGILDNPPKDVSSPSFMTPAVGRSWFPSTFLCRFCLTVRGAVSYTEDDIIELDKGGLPSLASCYMRVSIGPRLT